MVETVSTNSLFLLGGHDLEMLTIRELLQAHAPGRFIDKELAWGARTSDYRAEISGAQQHGETPILVELINDIDLDDKAIIIDHHGPLAGADKPTSLHQVFALLGLTPEAWTRRMELVAANDRGHIRGMLEASASMEEIVEIRAADRAAQGITEEQEQQATEAILSAETACGGRLTIIRIPHSRTAAVADRMATELGGPGYDNLLVISPGEVNFFGDGSAVLQLKDLFPDCWYGGSLPERGFFGIAQVPATIVKTVSELVCALTLKN
jgi:hypothetical protein